MIAADPIVIVGAGHAGVQAATALRDEGVDTPIALLSNERHTPYERPPLSKKYLQGKLDGSSILLRDPAFYARQRIDLVLSKQVVSVERNTKRVIVSPAESIAYSHLVLATGSKKRELPYAVPGDGVLSLRSLDDAAALRARLDGARSVAVIGAGFIGMEFAAVAAARGCSVTVIEVAARPLARSASAIVADFLLGAYRAKGIRFLLGERVLGFDVQAGRVSGVRFASGGAIAADLVLVGVGASPADELAKESGLPCPNGIEVDAGMRTSDPSVSAIGDCTWHPNGFAGRMLRLESVQNAADQARVLAKRIAGKHASYQSVPWFWSDLGDIRLQIAGILDGCEQHLVRGTPADCSFSVYGFRGGMLAGVESINRPADHLLARRLLTEAVPVSASQIADARVELKQLLPKPANG